MAHLWLEITQLKGTGNIDALGLIPLLEASPVASEKSKRSRGNKSGAPSWVPQSGMRGSCRQAQASAEQVCLQSITQSLEQRKEPPLSQPVLRFCSQLLT